MTRSSLCCNSKKSLRQALGKPKRQVPLAVLKNAVSNGSKIWPWPSSNRRWKFPEKLERYKRIAEVKSEVVPQALGRIPR